jgi:hypothetical protein
MAYKILVKAYDAIGNTYEPGVHGSYVPRDIDLSRLDDLIVTGRISFWKSLENKVAGFQQMQPIVSLEDKTGVGFWTKKLTEEEAAMINPAAIAVYAFDYLVSVYGEGNVEVVTE